MGGERKSAGSQETLGLSAPGANVCIGGRIVDELTVRLLGVLGVVVRTSLSRLPTVFSKDRKCPSLSDALIPEPFPGAIEHDQVPCLRVVSLMSTITIKSAVRSPVDQAKLVTHSVVGSTATINSRKR